MRGFELALAQLQRGVVSIKAYEEFYSEVALIGEAEQKMLKKFAFKVKNCTPQSLSAAVSSYESTVSSLLLGVL